MQIILGEGLTPDIERSVRLGARWLMRPDGRCELSGSGLLPADLIQRLTDRAKENPLLFGAALFLVNDLLREHASRTGTPRISVFL
jgi:hypothetical protein